MIDPSTKYFIKKLRDNNVSIGRVCSIIGVKDSSAMNPVRKETIRSLCAKVARENMADDIGKTVKLLREMKIMKDRTGDQRGVGGEWEPIKILRKNKTYVPNSTRRTSLLTAKVTHANK